MTQVHNNLKQLNFSDVLPMMLYSFKVGNIQIFIYFQNFLKLRNLGIPWILNIFLEQICHKG